MKNGIKVGVKLINDVSGLSFDPGGNKHIKKIQNSFCHSAHTWNTRKYAKKSKI